jgi:hypothetical protein
MTGRVGAGEGPRITVFAFWPTALINGVFSEYRSTHRSFKHGTSAQSWAGEHLSFVLQLYGLTWPVSFTVEGVKTPWNQIGATVDAIGKRGEVNA